jgi:hypothetical protein
MRTLCSLVPGEARADVHVDGERIAEANRSKQHFCSSKRICKTAKFNRVTVKVKNKIKQALFRHSVGKTPTVKSSSFVLLILNETDTGTKN